jgi:hypothetical protein
MIEILTMITKLLATIFLLFIILRILGYVYFQVRYFHRSRHLMAFLEKEDVSAWEYLDSHSFLWARNYRKAPYLGVWACRHSGPSSSISCGSRNAKAV